MSVKVERQGAFCIVRIQLAALPQNCLRSDRLSLYQQSGMEFPQAMANEFRLGQEVLSSGESAQGAARFAAGSGRHGST